jgi:hypothetical protein
MRRSPPLRDSTVEVPRRSADALASDGDHHHRRPAKVSESAGVERPPGAEAVGAGQAHAAHSHTASASRALFGAIKADLTAFGRHLAILLRSALSSRRPMQSEEAGARTGGPPGDSVSRRRAVIVPLIKGVAAAAVLVGIIITGGILWALHDAPVVGQFQSEQPSLVLESADGRPLGPLGIALGTVASTMAQFGLLSIPVLLVMMLLSGSTTPLESMPVWLKSHHDLF